MLQVSNALEATKGLDLSSAKATDRCAGCRRAWEMEPVPESVQRVISCFSSSCGENELDNETCVDDRGTIELLTGSGATIRQHEVSMVSIQTYPPHTARHGSPIVEDADEHGGSFEEMFNNGA